MNLVLDAHCHTFASGHAYGTVLEYVEEAKKSGMKLIAITDHGPAMPNSTGAFYFTNFNAVPSEIEGITLMMGIELNILNKNGEVDLDDRYLERISPVIASIHPPTFTLPMENMSHDDMFSITTETFINTMSNRHIQIIGHPGDTRYPFDIEAVVDASLETGTLLEINNASLLSTSFRYGARGIMCELLTECKKRSCPIVASSDAHFPLHVGKFAETLALFEEVGFPEELVVNLDTKRFLDALKQR